MQKKPVNENRLRLEEVAAIKNKLNEVEAQLKEECRINLKLRSEAEQKQTKLNMIEDTILAETEKMKWSVDNVLSAKIAFEEVSKKRIKELIEREIKLNEDISCFDLILNENARIEVQLKEVASHYFELHERNIAEHEARKQKNFDTRMSLDQVMRETIKDFTIDYEKRSALKMGGESEQASLENEKLFNEFSLREVKCEGLIKQQKESYEQLMRLRIAREVVSATAQIHQESVAQLMTRKANLDGHLEALNGSISNLEYYIPALRRRMDYKGSIQRQLDSLNSEVAAISAVRTSVRAKALSVASNAVKAALAMSERERSQRSGMVAALFDNLTGRTPAFDSDESSVELWSLRSQSSVSPRPPPAQRTAATGPPQALTGQRGRRSCPQPLRVF